MREVREVQDKMQREKKHLSAWAAPGACAKLLADIAMVRRVSHREGNVLAGSTRGNNKQMSLVLLTGSLRSRSGGQQGTPLGEALCTVCEAGNLVALYEVHDQQPLSHQAWQAARDLQPLPQPLSSQPNFPNQHPYQCNLLDPKAPA